MYIHKIFILLHSLSAIVWVGGMFFAHMVLRPVLLETEPPQRLFIWKGVFKKFFYWVWIAVITIIITGFAVIFYTYGGLSILMDRMHILIMFITGSIMAYIYFYIYFFPFKKFLSALENKNFTAAALHQGIMRKLVFTNLLLSIFLLLVVYLLR